MGIRFLQRDNRVTKALFVVIIAAASVSMVVYLIPGLTNTGVGSADTYAEIYPHWYSKFLHAGETVTTEWREAVAASAGRMVVVGLDAERAVMELARVAPTGTCGPAVRARAASVRIDPAGAAEAIASALAGSLPVLPAAR